MLNNLREPANNAVLPKALRIQYVCRIPEALKLSLAAARINRLAWMKCYVMWPRAYNSFMLESAHKLKWPHSFNWLNSSHICKMKNSGMAESFFPKQRPMLESLDTKLGSSTDTLWMNYVTCMHSGLLSAEKTLSWLCVSTASFLVLLQMAFIIYRKVWLHLN